MMQATRMPQPNRRTVAAELALGEELELLVVGVARDRARGADPPRGGGRGGRRGAGEAEVDGLADGPEGVGALGELVREGECGFLDERGLRLEHGCESC